MKITRIETIPVLVPLKAGMTMKTSYGEHAFSSYVIVRVHTDAGLVGLGEATIGVRWSGETSPGCVAAIEQVLSPLLVGRDPTQPVVLYAEMIRELPQNPFTRAAVEMALWDITGKAAGRPVYQLLGGATRLSIPIKMVVGAFETPQAVALARRFLDDGVRTLKVKVGPNPAKDVERVQAVRELAGPDIPIGIDANAGWSPAIARRMLAQLKNCDLSFIEQPIPAGNPAALREIRRSTSVPIMADESVFNLADAWNVAHSEAADVISVYPGKNGGIWGTVEIAHVAKAAGLALCIGSNLELGIGTAAMLHAAAAVAATDSDAFPADLIGPLYHEADLLREPLQLGPLTAQVPTGPGLGVELDEKQLERWRGR